MKLFIYMVLSYIVLVPSYLRAEVQTKAEKACLEASKLQNKHEGPHKKAQLIKMGISIEEIPTEATRTCVFDAMKAAIELNQGAEVNQLGLKYRRLGGKEPFPPPFTNAVMLIPEGPTNIGEYNSRVINTKKRRLQQEAAPQLALGKPTLILPGTYQVEGDLFTVDLPPGSTVRLTRTQESSVWPWVTAGTGAALLATGTFLMIDGHQQVSAASGDADSAINRLDRPAYDFARGEVSSGQDRFTTGSAIAIVGTALFSAGIAWLFLEEDREPGPVRAVPVK